MKNLSRNWIGIVLLLAVVLRLPGLGTRSLWLDEYTSIDIATRPIGAILTGAGFDSHTPPFYYAALHFWFALFPETEVGLRLFSLLVDLASIALLTILFSRQFSPTVGLAAGFFAALCPYAIYYAQEGRMYAMLVLLVAITYGLALRMRAGRAGPASYIAFFVVAVAGMYSHYYYALSFGAIVLGLGWSLRKRRRRLALVWGTAFLVGIAFLPWIKVVTGLLASDGQTFRQFSYSVFPYSLFRFGAGYGVLPLNYGDKEHFYETVRANLPLILLYVSVFGAALALGFRRLRRRFPDESVTLLAPLLLPPLLAAAINLYTPMLSERYLIVIFPFFAALLAVFASGLTPGKRAWWLALVLVVLTAVGTVRHYTNQRFANTQWRASAAVIDERSDLCSRVLVNPFYLSGLVDYYVERECTYVDPASSGPLLNLLLNADDDDCSGFWIIERGTAPSLESEAKKLGRFTVSEFWPHENGVRLLYVEPRSR